jgi:hypothetical protein
MNYIDDSIKNIKNTILKEVSGTAATSGFVGRAGDIIDQKFAGPFHPEFGELEDLLNQQIDNDIAKRMWTDEITPEFEEDFIDLEFDYKYDEEEFEIDKDNFINKSETNMKKVGINIKYDDKPEYAGKNFINKSNTNWEYIK